MEIVIVGPGAMGCLFAAFLAKAGQNLWLLDKNKQRAKEISGQGILVEGLNGRFGQPVKITSDPQDIPAADLLIICTKAYDTKEAVRSAKALIKDRTAVLTLQNGIGNIEIISESLGRQDVIAGVTNLGSTLSGIGKVIYAGRGETIIGRMDGKIPIEMKSIRQVFNRSGFETRITRDIKGLLWSKLVINVGINSLCAITRLNNGRLLDLEWTRRLLGECVTEAVKVAKRKRIKLVYDDPLAKVEAVCEATSGNISSMLQDVLRKKRTEVDFINGVIVRQAQELGISAPANSILLALVKTIESSYGFAL
jgi:2-dehydropantoate 2-reductase